MRTRRFATAILVALVSAVLLTATLAAPADAATGKTWNRLAKCESGGRWHINTGNGYYGGLQFLASTWRANGGSGMPHQASRAEQIRVAENLRSQAGFAPWPQCARKLGLL